jgi:nucleoside-diphosphate-sugar epimerase
MDKPTFLITGAQGFIGAWVVKRLLDTPADAGEPPRVVVFDRSADTRRLKMIMDEDELRRPRFVTGDITEAQAVERVVAEEGVTHIVHLAGLQVPICRADPRLGALVNVVGTINVFEAALKAKGQVKGLAYASSAAVFGVPEDGHAATEEEANNPTSHYGAFKRCNEDNARVYFLDHGLSSVGLRPLTVYGVGRDFGVTSDPTKAMKAAVVGRPFHIRFGGRTDFLYAADAADAFIRSATAGLEGAHVFNLHGESAEMAEIVAAIEREWPDAKGSVTHAETPLPIPPELDDTAIRSALGDLPSTPLSEGVRETIRRFAELQRAGRLDTADLDV